MTKTEQSDATAQDKETDKLDARPNDAFQERSLPGYAGVTLRGAVMGAADVIPGVSGGTMALILGIYRELIASIRAFDLHALKLLFRGQIGALIRHINLPFLIALGLGIGGAIVSLARVLPKLLKQHPAPVQGLFFGLILGSIFLVWQQVEKHNLQTVFMVALGAVGAYILVGLIPVETPNHLAFIFVAGMIAITAMILPGISGSFILLLLGKYAFILTALSQVAHQRKFDQNMLIVIVFAAGCGVGVLAFSRVLNWLLSSHQAVTMALLTGLMIGSLRRIWPFQTYQTKVIRHKERVIGYENIWPTQWTKEEMLAISLVVVGLVTVFVLHFVANKSKATKEA